MIHSIRQRNIAADERRRTVARSHGQLHLEQPSLVDVLTNRHLLVHQEQGHQPTVRSAAASPAHHDLRLRRIRDQRSDITVEQRHRQRATSRVPLPQPLVRTRRGRIRIRDLLVPTPRRRHRQRRTRRIDGSGEPDRRREQHDLRRLALPAGRTALVVARQVVIIATVRVDDRPLRRQHPDQVPLPHRRADARQYLVRLRRTEQIRQDQSFELGSQLGWRWRAHSIDSWFSSTAFARFAGAFFDFLSCRPAATSSAYR